MQNFQIMTNTNGVAKYVVKYVTDIDENNVVSVSANAHTGAVYTATEQSLHNTKIARSRQNERKAFNQSRKSRLPQGRGISPLEMLQQIVGAAEVMHNFRFVRISTKPFEFRSTTPLKLDNNGNLEWPENIDVTSPRSVSEFARTVLKLKRQMTSSQKTVYRHNGRGSSTKFDKVTECSLRPVELLELFPNLGTYFRWFHIDNHSSPCEEIINYLVANITQCCWFDAYGRRVFVRRRAFDEVCNHLNQPKFSVDKLSLDSVILKNFLLRNMEGLADNDFNQCFVQNEKLDLPVPVFSSITPHHPIPFLEHIMLVLGSYETELDFRTTPTIRDSFAKTKLIGPNTDNRSLKEYSKQIMQRIVDEILPTQPASLRKIDNYIVTADRLIEGIILHNEISTTELPSCLLTETLNREDSRLQAFWEEIKLNHLTAIYAATGNTIPNIPSEQDVVSCSKAEPLDWNIADSFVKFDEQSDESYREQKFAINEGKAAVDKYTEQFGPGATTLTKGLVLCGVPGSGKTHLNQLLTLYAMTKGLRVMTTSILAARAVALGGIHWHKVFCFHINQCITPYRAAELAFSKLNRKSQLKFLHIVLTMDVLVIDEAGQVSAQGMAALDVLLRLTRHSKLPFGGVLILNAMDHCQFGAIHGIPFLASSFILTDFIVIMLERSVRAHHDLQFQRLQNITRMSPHKLLSGPSLEVEFKDLLDTTLTFVPNWNDPRITPDVQRMYAKRRAAQMSTDSYVESCLRHFTINHVPYRMCHSEDFQQTVGSRAEFTKATSKPLIASLNKNRREPPRLLFFKGALYFATVNSGDDFFQSQLMILLDLPSPETIAAKAPIKMMVNRPGGPSIDVNHRIPSKEE